MSVPLRIAAATATVTLALATTTPTAYAMHRVGAAARQAATRPVLPDLVSQKLALRPSLRLLLRSLPSRAQQRAIELALVQQAVRYRRAELVNGWERHASRAVRYAYRQRGRPYVWGGTGGRGFDCSGLVQSSWRKAGVAIPRVAADQYHRIRAHISRSNLRPGDLIYFHRLGHVGMYLGHNRFIHSPHTGSHVQVARLNHYWRASYVGAVRPDWPHLPPVPTSL